MWWLMSEGDAAAAAAAAVMQKADKWMKRWTWRVHNSIWLSTTSRFCNAVALRISHKVGRIGPHERVEQLLPCDLELALLDALLFTSPDRPIPETRRLYHKASLVCRNLYQRRVDKSIRHAGRNARWISGHSRWFGGASRGSAPPGILIHRCVSVDKLTVNPTHFTLRIHHLLSTCLLSVSQSVAPRLTNQRGTHVTLSSTITYQSFSIKISLVVTGIQ